MQLSDLKFTAFLTAEFVTDYFAAFSVAKPDSYLLNELFSSLD